MRRSVRPRDTRWPAPSRSHNSLDPGAAPRALAIGSDPAGSDPAARLGAARDRLVHQLRHALGQAGQAHGAAVHGRAAERGALAQARRGGAHRRHKRVVHALLRPPGAFQGLPGLL